MPYGFNKKDTAQRLSRIAKGEDAEFNNRRRSSGSNEQRNNAWRSYFAIPDGVIPQGSQSSPVKGKAFVLWLNPNTGTMERAAYGANDATSIDVWNMGPKVDPDANDPLLPIIRLEADSHGVLWVNAQKTKDGKMSAELAFGATGTMQVYRNGADTVETIEVRWDRYEGNGDPVTTNLDVGAKWIPDEGFWRLYFIECE